MPLQFTLPELGENVTTGDVVRVLVAPGDAVKRDQPLLELETDKATIEVPSSVEGIVREVAVKAGDTVTVGQLILTLDGEREAGAAPPKVEAERRETATEPEARETPERAKETAERTQAEKEPRPALQVERGERREPEERRDKTPSARPARGEVVEISRAARAVPPAPPPPAQRDIVPASPAVRRLARELGVDLDEVRGTGPGGRIGPDDVKTHARGRGVRGEEAPGAGVPRGLLPDFAKWGPVERRPMRGVRRKTAEHVAEAWAAIPHVTQHDRADVTELEALRSRYAPRVERAGGKLTVTAIAIKVAAAALRRFPQFNTALDVASEEIIQKQYVHIGVAVDTERGLLVPVIRDADTKGITPLSVELSQLADKARSGKLTLEEMQGGCFTITNLGGIGGTYFTPIINYPEVAILGLSRATMEPVLVDGQFVPRLMLPLSLSYDHRVIDGADAVRFLRWVADALEQPFVMEL